MARKQSLQQFFEFALSDPDKPKALSMIALVHKVGMRDEEVFSCAVGDGGRSPDPLKLAELFQSRADTYAQELPGVQMFQVLCFYGEDQRTHGNRYIIAVNNNQDPTQNGLWTENPDAQGQTMQRMRHTEWGMQQIFNRQATLDNYSLRMIEMMTAYQGKLMHENAEAYGIVKEMMMGKIADDREFQIRVMKEKEGAHTRQALMTAMPALINNITGKEVFPESAEDTAIISAIAENVEEEHLPFIKSILPQPVVALLMPRITKELEKKKLEADALKKYTALTKGEGPDGEPRTQVQDSKDAAE